MANFRGRSSNSALGVWFPVCMEDGLRDTDELPTTDMFGKTPAKQDCIYICRSRGRR